MNRRSVFTLLALASTYQVIKLFQTLAGLAVITDSFSGDTETNIALAEIGSIVTADSNDVEKKIYDKFPETRSIASSIFSDAASSANNTLTRSALIRVENNITRHSEKKVFSHFFVHIPKAGGGSIMAALGNLLFESNEFQATEKKDRYRPCNEGTVIFFARFREFLGGLRCNLWGSERPYTSGANHVYTMIRNPAEHVLSMYFHCKESYDHRKYAHYMPSLDEWLNHHVERLETGVQNPKSNRMKIPPFHCYDPINIQSFFTRFNSDMTEEELYNRFDVIGSMDYFEKSNCAIFIRYTGYVPPRCVCNDVSTRSRKLLVDHGVVHHGATFNTTDEQMAKIMKLTALDHLLYKRVTNVFVRQVEEIEEELGIILCD